MDLQPNAVDPEIPILPVFILSAHADQIDQ
jgi:hypothetical protein